MSALCLVTLCAVCAEELCDWSRLHIMYMYVYICHKISLIWHLPDQNSPEKRSWCFLFALRHHKCDGQLLVHPRSSLLGPGGQVCHEMVWLFSCATPHFMHNNSTRLFGLDSARSVNTPTAVQYCCM